MTTLATDERDTTVLLNVGVALDAAEVLRERGRRLLPISIRQQCDGYRPVSTIAITVPTIDLEALERAVKAVA